MESKTVTAGEESEKRKRILDLEDMGNGKIPLDEKALRGSGECTVNMIRDMELKRDGWYPAVNVLNRERYIANLPENGVVEIPCDIRSGKICPAKIGNIPEET
jgi:alpha-galactosidase/6-phospho-beta-glucosidase family protein